MSRILIVLCLAAASFGAAAQEPPVEPVQDLYLIVLQPDQRGEPPFDPSSFGGRLEHRKGSRLAVRMTAEAAASVEQNPRVKTVQRITLGRSARPEGGRPDARVITNGNDSLTTGIYTYDGSGNIRAIGPNSDGGTDQFTYDEFGRLASAKVHSGGTPHLESYGYDPAGNLTQFVKPNLTINLPADAATNRLSSSLGVDYDDVGHLTHSPVGYYTYDQMGMMSGTGSHTYIYTASDERLVIVSTAGGWRWTLRDLDARKIREYESQRDEFFLWLEDDYHDGQRLIASQRETAEGGRRHYHPDHLGTPRLITNASGQRISTHDYYPFGVEITSIHQEATRGYGREQTAQFTGHERDDLGSSLTQHSVYLDYMHARFYNPNWGRFLTVDPAAESADASRPQTWNRYAYAENNPVLKTDPDGEWAHSAVGAVIGGFAGLAVGGFAEIKKGYSEPVTPMGSARRVLGAVAGGAASGALAATCLACNPGIQIGIGANASMLGGVLNRAIAGQEQSIEAAQTDAIAGAVGAGVGNALGSVARQASSSEISKNVVKDAILRTTQSRRNIGHVRTATSGAQSTRQLQARLRALTTSLGEAAQAATQPAIPKKTTAEEQADIKAPPK